jgi:hypothetical protein
VRSPGRAKHGADLISDVLPYLRSPASKGFRKGYCKEKVIQIASI